MVADRVMVVSAGPVRVAVIGVCPITATRLREMAAGSHPNVLGIRAALLTHMTAGLRPV